MSESSSSGFRNFLVKNENKITGLLYFGAAFLIIVIGLRGLGEQLKEVDIITKVVPFILDESGRIDIDLVLGALLLEFSILVILAITTAMKTNDNQADEEAQKKALKSQLSILSDPVVKQALEEMNLHTKDQLQSLEEFIKRYEILQKRLNRIQIESVNHLKNIEKLYKMS